MNPRIRRRNDLLAARARIDAELARLDPACTGRLRVIPLETLLAPDEIQSRAEKHRNRALAHYGDSPQQQAERLHTLNADAASFGDVKPRRKKEAA